MSPMTATPMPAAKTAPSSGGRIVSLEGNPLPFCGCSLEADARGGLARVVLRQTFINESNDPFQATYQMPLPTDAAVGAYTFTIGDRRVVGKIDRRETARARFEEAILDGHTAALLEQDRSSVFTQEIGNIPAHTEVTCELVLDQKLRWLEDGQWEWRFPTVIAPRYMGSEGRVPDAERIAVDVSEQGLSARASLAMKIRDRITTGEPTSSTHPLAVYPGDALTEVSFKAEEGAALDRDIVVRWATAAPEVGVTLDTARPSAGSGNAEFAFGLLTLTPPSSDSVGKAIARDLIILIDTSGSMSGRPLEMAQRVALGVIDSLEEQDSLEMIEFSSEARRWQNASMPGTKQNKSGAVRWVRALQAGGATEMQSGLEAALSSLRPEAQRQVLLISDGLVGFEDEMVRIVRERSDTRSRVHSVGIGSAANRSLTGAVARAGGGAEFLIDVDEDVSAAASRIIARTSRPLCVDVRIGGNALIHTACNPIPDLLAGAPSLVPVKLNPAGGDLVVEGHTADGHWTQRIRVDACEPATGNGSIPRLFGREWVEELVLDATAGEDVESAIERIGLEFGISTRVTSWIAISEEATVDQREPVRRVRIAQQLPYGMSVEGLGLREAEVRTASFNRLCCPPSGPLSLVRAKRARPEMSRPSRHQAEDACEMEIGDTDQPIGQTDRFMHDASADAQPSRTNLLSGRLVSLSDGRCVFEIDLDTDLVWRPEHVAVIDEPNATLDLSATTKSGAYGPGQTIRLVITGCSAEFDAKGQRIMVRCRDLTQPIIIQVAP